MVSRKVAFFKSSAAMGSGKQLTHKRVAANHRKGLITTVIPDANVLIDIERLMNRGGRWSEIKTSGLGELVSLAKKSPSYALHIAPGIALDPAP